MTIWNYVAIGGGLTVAFGLGYSVGSYFLYFGKSCMYHGGPGLGCMGPCGASLRGERARLLAFKEDIDQKIALCPEEGSPNREFASQIEEAKKCLAIKNPAYAKLNEVFWSLHDLGTFGAEENSPNRANRAHQ